MSATELNLAALAASGSSGVDAFEDSPTVAEARRTMEICNACRYCEGFCPVFPAMERRRAFSAGDLGHLANLCFNCKGCWYSCQYAPPHAFGLNLPQTFAELRVETYSAFAWPRFLAPLFERNGLWVALSTGIILALVLIGATLLSAPGALTGSYGGDFYKVMPHETMAILGGVTFGWAVLAMLIGAIRYWRGCGAPKVDLQHWITAFREAGQTKHLGGAGDGCNDIDERYGLGRRHGHTAMLWGFLLCFAATSAGTLMHYLLGWEAPYSWYSAPVVLGTVGGALLVVGPATMFSLKLQSDQEPAARRHYGMDYALLALLVLVSLSGLGLLFFRDTTAMGWLLMIHLGFVFALFITMPYGKFVHGIYRTMALARDAAER